MFLRHKNIFLVARSKNNLKIESFVARSTWKSRRRPSGRTAIASASTIICTRCMFFNVLRCFAIFSANHVFKTCCIYMCILLFVALVRTISRYKNHNSSLRLMAYLLYLCCLYFVWSSRNINIFKSFNI